LQDVVVQPSVTVVENADRSKTIIYSAPVPANRESNGEGAAERFRVVVGTPMRQANRSVFIPAPPPAIQQPAPAADRGYSVSPALEGNPAA
jgi:hypothetical protein